MLHEGPLTTRKKWIIQFLLTGFSESVSTCEEVSVWSAMSDWLLPSEPTPLSSSETEPFRPSLPILLAFEWTPLSLSGMLSLSICVITKISGRTSEQYTFSLLSSTIPTKPDFDQSIHGEQDKESSLENKNETYLRFLLVSSKSSIFSGDSRSFCVC